MARRLPRALSPQARYRLLRAAAGERVRCLVRVGPTGDVEDLTRRIGRLGGTTGFWNPETGLLTVELPAVQLGELAELDGVVQVDADAAYGPD